MVPPRWKCRQWRRRVSITVLCLDNAIITAFHHTFPGPKLARNEVTITGPPCFSSPFPTSSSRMADTLGLDENSDNDNEVDDDDDEDEDEEDRGDARNSGCRGNVRGQTEPQ